jgi:L-ascorbate metabolism protein UlaG (beta-lactamase superfamily)
MGRAAGAPEQAGRNGHAGARCDGGALLFAGAARIAGRFDGALLTLDSDLAAEAARVLGARSVVPVHYAGWQHFTEDGTSLRAAFDRAGLADRLVLLAPGESASLPT